MFHLSLRKFLYVCVVVGVAPACKQNRSANQLKQPASDEQKGNEFNLALDKLPPVDAASLKLESPEVSVEAFENSVDVLILKAGMPQGADYMSYSICSKEHAGVCISGETASGFVRVPHGESGALNVKMAPCVRVYHALAPEVVCGESFERPISKNPTSNEQTELALADTYKAEGDLEKMCASLHKDLEEFMKTPPAQKLDPQYRSFVDNQLRIGQDFCSLYYRTPDFAELVDTTENLGSGTNAGEGLGLATETDDGTNAVNGVVDGNSVLPGVKDEVALMMLGAGLAAGGLGWGIVNRGKASDARSLFFKIGKKIRELDYISSDPAAGRQAIIKELQANFETKKSLTEVDGEIAKLRAQVDLLKTNPDMGLETRVEEKLKPALVKENLEKLIGDMKILSATKGVSSKKTNLSFDYSISDKFKTIIANNQLEVHLEAYRTAVETFTSSRTETNAKAVRAEAAKVEASLGKISSDFNTSGHARQEVPTRLGNVHHHNVGNVRDVNFVKHLRSQLVLDFRSEGLATALSGHDAKVIEFQSKVTEALDAKLHAAQSPMRMLGPMIFGFIGLGIVTLGAAKYMEGEGAHLAGEMDPMMELNLVLVPHFKEYQRLRLQLDL